MDVREKLIDIVCDAMESDSCIAHCNHSPCFEVERVVNALIDNGVTVQEWIPVTERLPEPKENAICLNRHGDMMICTYTEWGWMFPCYFEVPTHWMPLPHPLKGE